MVESLKHPKGGTVNSTIFIEVSRFSFSVLSCSNVKSMGISDFRKHSKIRKVLTTSLIYISSSQNFLICPLIILNGNYKGMDNFSQIGLVLVRISKFLARIY